MNPKLMHRTAIVIASSACFFFLAGPIATVSAQVQKPMPEIEGVSFPAAIGDGDERLDLFGLGLLRYRIFFRGYVGGLYLPAGTKANEVLSDVPKALELSYFWAIKGKLFGEAATQILEQQHGPERVAEYQAALEKLHALYRDVAVGDRYRLTYRPGSGTELALNGKVLGQVPGAQFAQDYFGIWLGKDPLNEDFRNSILEKR